MNTTEPQFIRIGSDQRRIAVRHTSAAAGKPGLFWLSGFMSDMASTKATAIAEWAAANGFAATRFDYSGHGLSSGAFTDGTIGRWLEEAIAVFKQATKGPQIVIGSSMGGHIALMLLKTLLSESPADAARIKGLVLIAPAWDMTEELMWKRFPPEARREIMEHGAFQRPSAYAAPYTITRGLIEDGRNHLLARTPFDPGRPVIIIQGRLDADVPVEHVRELLTFLKGDHARMIEIPDGEHRLSRPQDLVVLFDQLRSLA